MIATQKEFSLKKLDNISKAICEAEREHGKQAIIVYLKGFLRMARIVNKQIK